MNVPPAEILSLPKNSQPLKCLHIQTKIVDVNMCLDVLYATLALTFHMYALSLSSHFTILYENEQ